MAVTWHIDDQKTASIKSTSITVDRPDNVSEDDLLIAIIVSNRSASPLWGTIPSGWTSIRQQHDPGLTTRPGAAAFYKLASDSEPTDYTWSDGANDEQKAIIGRVTGHSTSNPIGEDSGNHADTGTSLELPSIGADGGLLIGVWGWQNSGNDVTLPGSMTLVHQLGNLNSNNPDCAVGEEQVGSGSTGTRTATHPSSNRSVGLMFEIPIGNVPPNAPPLVYPINNVAFNRAQPQVFDHEFSDPDPGDSQSKFDLRYRIAGAGSWAETLTFVTSSTEHEFAGNYFAAGEYEWQVRTYDSTGTEGPWSDSGFFTAADKPASPTITDPIGGQTIATEEYDLVWSTPEQASYQVRKVADDGGSPDAEDVLFDTGAISSASRRSRTLTFPVNNRTEHLQVRIKVGGLWSDWASVLVNVSYTEPETPTFIVTNQPEDGRKEIDITNPPPGVDVPSVTENWVHRRALGEADWVRIIDGIAPNGTVYDYTAAANESYEYMVTARGDNGTSSDSAVVESDPLLFRGVWLHEASDASTRHHFLYNDRGGDESWSDEMSLQQYAGRQLPVAEYGESATHQVDVELATEVDTGDYDALRDLLRSKSILCYRDSYGRKLFFAPDGFREKRRSVTGRFRLRVVGTDYSEDVD